MEAFLRILPRDLTHAFEFRDGSWFCPEVERLLARYGAVFCIHDHPDAGS